MRSIWIAFGILTSIHANSTVLSAQTQRRFQTWEELLAWTVRYERPEGSPLDHEARCGGSVVIPDSIAVVSGRDTAATISVWMRTWRQTEWESFRLPMDADTLRTRVVRAYCAFPDWPPEFTLQNGEFFLKLTRHNLARSDSRDATGAGAGPTEGWAYVVAPDGSLDVAVLLEDCSRRGVCQYQVTGVSTYRDSVLVAERARAEAEERAKVQRATAIRAKRWQATFTAAVIDRKVQVGMLPEMVRLAWGEPESVNTTITAHGTTEQWVYGPGSYVYFENGKVSAIQVRR